MLERIKQNKGLMIEVFIKLIFIFGVAAILISIGSEEVLNIEVLRKAGEAIVRNSTIIIALSITVRITKMNVKFVIATVLVAVVYESTYWYSLNVNDIYILKTFNSIGIVRGVFIGTIISFICTKIYSNRTEGEDDNIVELLMPVIVILGCVFLGLITGVLSKILIQLLEPFVYFIFITTEHIGTFFYGILHKATLVLGIQPIFEYTFWLEFGERFLHGDGSLSDKITMIFSSDILGQKYITGNYLTSIFSIPAAVFAIYKNIDKKEKRKYLIMGITGIVGSILSGMTVFIEIFILIFSPMLYGVHMILSGMGYLFLDIMEVSVGGVKDFGLIQLIYNIGDSGNYMKIIPVGIIMVGAYFFSYTILIKRKKRKNDEVLFLNKEMKQGKMIEIVCPMDGELLELEDVPDKDFSDKINGDGFAILPDNGDIFSPIDGVVSKINEKKKTIKIFHSNEVELLINFGVESSFINHMECEFFVHEGDKVKVRDLLMRVDIGDINKDAASIITPVVFTSLPENMEIVVHPGKKIKMGERNIIVIEEKKQ